MHDFLCGVIAVPNLTQTASEDAFGAVRTNEGQVISPADRVRYVHHLLTAAPVDEESSRTGSVGGAGLSAPCSAFPHLVDMMPLHDRDFNAAWIKAWSNVSFRSIMMGISEDEIETLRFHFGEKIALYFAFLNTYFTSLAPAAVLGLMFWLTGEAYNPVYAVMLILWACTFVEVWRLRERKLAVRWGTTNLGNTLERRAAFRPRTVTRDPVTGETLEVYEWWRRELRVIASLPVVLLFVVLLIATLTAIFFIEVIVAEVYDGPGKGIVPLIPTILFSTCVPAIQGAWQATARALTGWENHATNRSYNSSLTIKIFGLQSLVTYGGLVLTAFVYIPFGERLIHWMFDHGYLTRLFQFVSRQPNFQMPSKLHFEVHPVRLYNQLFALCVTGQVTNTVTEVLVPIALRSVTQWKDTAARSWACFRRKDTKERHRVSFASDRVERSFLERVHTEFALPTYDVFADYAEMATQLGNITLWSAIWPLAPVMGYVNNFFELRSDAYKIIVNMRRPVPVRTDTIGTWVEVFSFLVRIAVFVNASLVYLFEDRHERSGISSAVHTTMRSYLHPHLPQQPDACKTETQVASLLPHFLPKSSAAGALAASFLFALVCEQLYGILRVAVQHVLERVMWRDSEEERAVRRMQHENRVSLVGRLERTEGAEGGLHQVPAPLRARIHPDMSFWDASHDSGLSYIASAAKAA